MILTIILLGATVSIAVAFFIHNKFKPQEDEYCPRCGSDLHYHLDARWCNNCKYTEKGVL